MGKANEILSLKPVVKGENLVRFEKYLGSEKDLWELDKEKDKAAALKYFGDQLDIILKTKNNFDLKTSDRLCLLLTAIIGIDKKVYDIVTSKVSNFLNIFFNNELDRLKKAKQISLNEFDIRFRQLYKISERIDIFDEKLGRKKLCYMLIRKLENVLFEKLDEQPEILEEYITANIKNLSPIENLPEDKTYNKAMDSLFGILKQRGLVDRALVNGVVKYSKIVNGEKWCFELVGNNLIAVRSEKNPDLSTIIGFFGMEGLEHKIEAGSFNHIIELATDNYEKDRLPKEKLAAYEMPRDKAIQYLRLIPSQYDETISNTIFGSSLFAYILKNRYPNMRIDSIDFAHYAKKNIRERIKKSYQSGVRLFVLDIYSHGDKENFTFFDAQPTLDSADYFNADDIMEIAKQFPDAKFQINTIACYGAGIRDKFLYAFKRSKAKKEQFSIFLQSRANTINLVATQNNPNMQKYFSSYYYLFLMQALLDGKKYGEAVIIADEKAKKIIYVNAESIIDGTLIGLNLDNQLLNLA